MLGIAIMGRYLSEVVGDINRSSILGKGRILVTRCSRSLHFPNQYALKWSVKTLLVFRYGNPLIIFRNAWFLVIPSNVETHRIPSEPN